MMDQKTTPPWTERPIYVMHIICNLDSDGGMENILVDGLLRMDLERVRPMVCCVVEKGIGGLAARLEKDGIPVWIISKRGRWDLAYPWRLARLLKDQQVDVVHSYSGVYRDGCLAALLARVRVIVHTDHGRFYPDRRWTRWNHRFFSRFRDRVIGVSNSVGEFLIDEVGIAPDKVMTIYDGIDLAVYRKFVDRTAKLHELGLPTECLVVGMVSRMVPVKDHKTFLKAARLVVEAVPKAHFVLVGDGPLEADLKNEVEELGISTHVSFLGFRKDIPELMRLFDLIVLSSLHESFSLVLAEAMACEKAVVATRVGGIPEVVEDGVTGLLVPPREPESLARSIVELLTDPPRRKAMGLAGKARVEERFSIETMVCSHEALYESLLEQKGLLSSKRASLP